MKHIIVLFALLVALPLSAQRDVETSVALGNDQDLFLHFKFARNIKIEQWSKNEVSVKAQVTVDDGEGNDAYSLKTDKSSSTVEIYSDFGNYFKNRQNNYGWRNRKHSETKILYTVYVPMNVNLRIKSISGSVESSDFKGMLRTNLVSGNVTIKKYDGELWLKTVSGDLDVTMNKAEVNAKTLTGTIYSNLDNLDIENKGRRGHGHNKIIGTINSGGDLVKMETVSGDIYLRKS